MEAKAIYTHLSIYLYIYNYEDGAELRKEGKRVEMGGRRNVKR